MYLDLTMYLLANLLQNDLLSAKQQHYVLCRIFIQSSTNPSARNSLWSISDSNAFHNPSLTISSLSFSQSPLSPPKSCSTPLQYRLVFVISLQILLSGFDGESNYSETPFLKTNKPLIARKLMKMASWLRDRSFLVDYKRIIFNQKKK